MDYYGDFYNMMGSIAGSLAASYVFNFIFTFVLYILRSMGLFGLAKNRGMGSGGAAWIPLIGGGIMTGAVADDISKKNGSNSVFRFLIPLGALLSWILIGVGFGSWIPMFIEMAQYGDMDYIMNYMLSSMMAGMAFILLACLVAIATYIIQIVALHKIYKCYRPDSSTAWTVVSVIFAFMQSIFPFMLRNDVPFAPSAPQPAGYYPPPAQPYAPQPQNNAAPYNPYGQPQAAPVPPPVPEQPAPSIPEQPDPSPEPADPWEK